MKNFIFLVTMLLMVASVFSCEKEVVKPSKASESISENDSSVKVPKQSRTEYLREIRRENTLNFNGRSTSVSGELKDGGDRRTYTFLSTCGAYRDVYLTFSNNSNSRADLECSMYGVRSNGSTKKLRGWYNVDPGDSKTIRCSSSNLTLWAIEYDYFYLIVENDSWWNNRPVNYGISYTCN